MKTIAWIPLSMALFAVNAAAITLDDLDTGKTVHGPNLALKDMKGKVVFVNYWGTR